MPNRSPVLLQNGDLLLLRVIKVKKKNKSSAHFNHSLTTWELEILILKVKVKGIIDQIIVEPRLRRNPNITDSFVCPDDKLIHFFLNNSHITDIS